MKNRALTKQPGNTERGKPSNQISSPPPPPPPPFVGEGNLSINCGCAYHTTKDLSQAVNVNQPGRRLSVVNIEELASGVQTTQPTGA